GGAQGFAEDLLRASTGPEAPLAWAFPWATLGGVGLQDTAREMGMSPSAQLVANMIGSGGRSLATRGMHSLLSLAQAVTHPSIGAIGHGLAHAGIEPMIGFAEAIPRWAAASGGWPQNQLTSRPRYVPDYVYPSGRDTSPFP